MTEQGTMTDEQVDRLRADLEFITDHRGAHDQDTWSNGAKLDESGKPVCGTAGCLAGWATVRAFPYLEVAASGILLRRNSLGVARHPDGVRTHSAAETAQHLYGLDDVGGAHAALFDGGRTLREQWEYAAEVSGGRITVPADLEQRAPDCDDIPGDWRGEDDEDDENDYDENED